MTGVSVKYLRRTGWDRSRFLQALFSKAEQIVEVLWDNGQGITGE